MNHAPCTRRPAFSRPALMLGLLAAMLVVGTALADGETPALQLDLDAYRIELVEEGDAIVERRVLALEVAPGDQLEWWLRAVNSGSEALPGLALDLPIPAGTWYLADTADLWRLDADGEPTVAGVPAFTLLVSADGGASFQAEPLMRTVVEDRDGARVEVEEVMPPEAYTHLRVVLEALPGESTLVLIARTIVR